MSLQILIIGIATAAICRTIVYYDGPFGIFPRFKCWLLPLMHRDKGLESSFDHQSIESIEDVMENFSQIMMDEQQIEGQVEMWKVYHTQHNPKFKFSFRGTLYDVLDCPFCLGPYVSTFLSVMMVLYIMFPFPINNWDEMWVEALLHMILISCGAYGIHFLISKWWSNE